MARDEQVRIDLVADDKASAVVKDVAGAVADLEDEKVEIPLTADDEASRVIEDVSDEARALSGQEAEIVLRAKVDAARADLKNLQTDLKQTGDVADTTARQLDRVDGPGAGGGGLNTRGNAIADLTGPLGEASGAASDFAGVFDGLGDIAEDVAGKLGASPAAVAGLSTAIGGLGIAVAAGAAIWSTWTGRQKAAAEAAKKTREEAIKLNDALRSGNEEQFADALVEQYGAVFDAAQKAGISIGETTDYITGMADAVPSLEAQLAILEARMGLQRQMTGEVSAETWEQYRALISVKQEIIDAMEAYKRGDITAGQYRSTIDQVTAAVGRHETATDDDSAALRTQRERLDGVKYALDTMKTALDMEAALIRFSEQVDVAMWKAADGTGNTAGEINDLKRDIITLAETADANPAQVKATLEKIDQGDYNGARADAEGWFARNPVRVATQLSPPRQTGGGGGGSTAPIPTMVPVGAGAGGGTVIHVSQFLPRGYRERDTLTAASSAARRAGGLYRQARS